MTKPRKQANFRRRVALLFFLFLIINIGLKIAGVSTLDTGTAVTSSHAFGMKVSYFLIPGFFLLIGMWFAFSSRSKSVEAESVEIDGCSW